MLQVVAAPALNTFEVKGAVADERVTALLGRQYFQVGPHVVGFDDAFAEPVVVRAYYDFYHDKVAQEHHRHSPFDTVGYMQFCYVSFGGRAIRPAVYGGRLADRDAYADRDHGIFVDFMAPEQVQLHFKPPPPLPFYPYNGVLTTEVGRAGFAIHPLPKGSMIACRPTEVPPPEQRPVCASIYAELAPGLLTRKEIDKAARAEQFLCIPATGREAYQEAWDYLSRNSWPLASEPPPLDGLTKSQVAAQAIGRYTLLTLPDPENEGTTDQPVLEATGATLCIWKETQGGQDWIFVVVLSPHDMTSLKADATSNALQRIYSEVAVTDDVDMTGGEPVPGVQTKVGRGQGGLSANPFTFDPASRPIHLRYLTCAVGQRHHDLRNAPAKQFLSGFCWTAQLAFDSFSRTLELTTVQQPELLMAPWNFDGAIERYKAAVTAVPPGAPVDMTNFIEAALLRDDFAGSSKLTFIDAGGRPV
ncbi:hypothetical protein [Streptomyces sp. NPDC057429]|uniref:hypothetical protein n=1 Tax=Streptomyces sp. NPDC057429 TaxID=3346130 RepID=UPI0036B5FC63